jgi:hypothetical protein
MNPEEMWQVDAGGQIYETSFDELKQWVIEGAVLPSDKIRRGNLRWLEAGKVPLLHSVFNAVASGTSPQIQTNVTQVAPAEEPQINNFTNVAPNNQLPSEPATPLTATISSQTLQQPARQANALVNQNGCSVHLEVESQFVCLTCEQKFCKSCPKAFGDVRICPACGEMCKSINDVQRKNQERNNYENAISEGFGFGDFTNALAYPFKHPTSLLIGGVMFAVFSIGQSALNLGALYVVAGGIIGMMLANMIAFACLSNTIDEFSKGNLTANFMPSFDDFNLWDDVVHPFFLSVGVYLVSFGLLIAIAVGGAYLAFSSMKSQMGTMMDLPIATSPKVETVQPTLNSFEDLMKKDAEQKAKLAELKGQTNPVQPPTQNATNNQVSSQPFAGDDTEKMVADADKMINDYRKGQAEAMIGPSPETEQMQQQMLFATLMKYGAGFFLLAFVGLIWAMFYYPAACLVAGYTRSFTAVINPLVGLDTIKRLGFSYVKILLMEILLSIILGVVIMIIGVILSPFDLPRVGNIPAILVTSFIYFYYYIAFAAILGYAVYKCKNLLSR